MDLRIGKDRFRPESDDTKPSRVDVDYDEIERRLIAVEQACAELRRALGRDG